MDPGGLEGWLSWQWLAMVGLSWSKVAKLVGLSWLVQGDEKMARFQPANNHPWVLSSRIGQVYKVDTHKVDP